MRTSISTLKGVSVVMMINIYQFSSGQLLSSVWLFAIPRTAVRQASLSITNSRSLLKLMSIELVMPSNHFILCSPLLFPLSIFPSIRVFSNESFLHIRWPKYWSFSFSISPSNEYSGLISFRKLHLLYWLCQNLWLCGSQQTGKFLKRWEYQTTWPTSWETCMHVRKQQLELDMGQQTGSK